jgi:hypothetical protein
LTPVISTRGISLMMWKTSLRRATDKGQREMKMCSAQDDTYTQTQTLKVTHVDYYAHLCNKFVLVVPYDVH